MTWMVLSCDMPTRMSSGWSVTQYSSRGSLNHGMSMLSLIMEDPSSLKAVLKWTITANGPSFNAGRMNC